MTVCNGWRYARLRWFTEAIDRLKNHCNDCQTFALPHSKKRTSVNFLPMKNLFVIALLCIAPSALRAQAPSLDAVHEWGTFTTFSGSDGVALPWWTPVLEGPSVLPEFVQSVALKSGTPHVMRMETPVLYFYASKAMEVNVRVDYRQGVLTEVFPPGKQEIVQPFNPFQPSSAYAWEIGLLPPDSSARDSIPAVGTRGSHYGHAREVPDAWIVRSKPRPGDAANTSGSAEKFIFYRGAGGPPFPLQASLREDGSLGVNTTSEITTDAFLVRVQGGIINWRGSQIAMKPEPDGRIQPFTMARPEAGSTSDGLAAALRQALSSAGLTPAEAAAMVATWQEAWLGEDGTRLLYLIPESWINERLPLQINPKPRELKRVFVARNELFSPQQEQVLMKSLTGTHTDAERGRMISSLRLGRFANPALERAVKISEQNLRQSFFNAMVHGNGVGR